MPVGCSSILLCELHLNRDMKHKPLCESKVACFNSKAEMIQGVGFMEHSVLRSDDTRLDDPTHLLFMILKHFLIGTNRKKLIVFMHVEGLQKCSH